VIALDEWRLDVGGRCENPFSVSWQEFSRSASRRRQRFSLRDDLEPHGQHVEGRRFRTLAELAVPAPDVTHVLCTGYDTCRAREFRTTTNLPLARAVEDDVLLVHTWEDAPLPQEHGGPCRMITPKLYAWKGTKWIRKIEFLAGNKRGFWEERGYSDTAEPWYDDRYSY
jgi:DMSO/TMAO reductase YedYZ molybdopterin-dependent catalytic subunit